MGIEISPALKCALCGHSEGAEGPLLEVETVTGIPALMHRHCKQFYFDSKDWVARRREFQHRHSNLAHWWTSRSILLQTPHMV